MGRKVIDLTGRRFERWLVLSENGRNKAGGSRWLCLCKCGTIKTIDAKDLKTGDSKSCGCLLREKMTTHGLSKHSLYTVWCNMIGRCYRLSSISYKTYGDQGVSVCPEWKENFISFYRWGLSTGWKEGLSIDRIENEGNYEPDNCQFISLGLNVVKQRVLRSTNTSGYKGVHFEMQTKMYRAAITIKGREIKLGRYSNPKAAALVYDKAARLTGDNRSLNFE
jgi:hypothetical protein